MSESIHKACRSGNLDAVRRLVAANPAAVDADDNHGWRPLFHAGLSRHIDVVQFLIEAGADVAAHNGDALHYAAEVPGNQAIITLLLQYGALEAYTRPQDDLLRQFLAAVFLADQSRVGSLLLRSPELASRVDGRGNQPLHHAACHGDAEILRLLIAHGADINERNAKGHTVLYCAAGHGHLDALQLLLAHGADANATFTTNRLTLLEWLAQYPDDERFLPIANALIEHAKTA